MFEYLCGTMSGIPFASYAETENYITLKEHRTSSR